MMVFEVPLIEKLTASYSENQHLYTIAGTPK